MMTLSPNSEFLPEPLPSEPFSIFKEWLDEAWRQRVQPNANAMVLASVDDAGNPAARVVLCKQLVAQPGYLVFFTNYLSHKGEQLKRHPQTAAVFHWDALHRQVRVTGPVVKSPDEESDQYFASRQLASRVSAWASRQSEPLASRAQFAAQIDEVLRRYNIASDATDGTVPRPPHWGGYRLWPETVELWVEGPGRVHDRAIWKRNIRPADRFTFACGAWSATRLNP